MPVGAIRIKHLAREPVKYIAQCLMHKKNRTDGSEGRSFVFAPGRCTMSAPGQSACGKYGLTMLKELLVRTLDKVRALRPDELCTLTVEEADMLHAYLQVHERRSNLSPQERAFLDHLRSVLAAWHVLAASPPQWPRPSGPKERTQWVLRTAVDKLLNRAYDKLGSGEVQLARTTLDTLSQLETPNTDQERLTWILQEALDNYDLYLQTRPPDILSPIDMGVTDAETAAPVETADVETATGPDAAGGVPEQGEGPHVVSAASYEGVERKVYQTLPGIPVNITARGLEFRGDVTVEGDIPEDVLVLVRQGGIVVRGYVFGYVVADRDITVHGNVQGAWLVSSAGNVVVERVFPGARITAQRGSISCNGCESPERLFAGDTLTVHGNVTGGKLLARDMEIRGTVTGAELHTAGRLRAQRFDTDPRRGTIVCLRALLTSQDYGVPLGESTTAMKRAMAKHAYQAAVAWRAITHLQQDISNCRRAMLYYLLAGSDSNVAIRHLRVLQTQSVFLDRIVTMGVSLSRFLHAARETGGSVAAREIEDLAEENLKVLRALSKDIKALPEEYGATMREPLIQTARRLGTISKRIVASAKAESDVSAHLESLDRQLEKWRTSYVACGEKIASLVEELGLDPDIAAKIESDPAELEPMLAIVLADARNSPHSELARRSRSAVMRLLESTIERHRENIAVWRGSVDAASVEQQALTTRLAEEGAILFGGSRPGGTYVCAGHFSGGVMITSVPDKTEGTDTARAQVICIKTPIETDTVFTLKEGLVHRMPTASRAQ